MAKKSNKTEHVLKLITKNDDMAEDENFFSIDKEISEKGTSAVQKSIKEKTEKEPAEVTIEEKQQPQAETEPIAAEETAAAQPPVEPAVPESPAEPAVSQEPAEAIIPESPAEPAEAIIPESPAEPAAPEPPTLRAFREQEKAGSAMLEQYDNLVNIAEILAREKLSLVMERMKVCTCRTCVNDVLALALNSLPTKYVTTDSGKQYFQLDIYKKQYETDILAALTKACVRVKASPRH